MKKVVREIDYSKMPVTLERFKKHMRIAIAAFDDDLLSKLKAAFANAENYIGQYLIPSTLTITGDFASVTVPNLTDIESVKSNGEEVLYAVRGDKILFDKDTDIELVCTAGGCDKEDILQAVLLIAAAMFNNPVDSVEQLPKASQMLLRPYRAWTGLI
nr:MAG TPA: head tail connector [Caudoviricetes sp.]